MKKTATLACHLIFILLAASTQAANANSDSQQLNLEDILNLTVISASKAPEKIRDIPSTVHVVTQEQIRERGYKDLSEIFDDLPGMDIVRPYGDAQYKNYWRGFRNTIGDPFLLLIDGMEFNALWTNTNDMAMVSLPLSNIDRVEVIYGPASSIYGANAFMGIVNVITLKPAKGTLGKTRLMAGADSRKAADATLLHQTGDWSLSLSARIDKGELNNSKTESYEFTKAQYHSNPQIWGNYITQTLGYNSFKSEILNKAVDARLRYKDNWELGLIYLRNQTGYGLIYPADKYQNNGLWIRPELSLHLSYSQSLAENLHSKTLLRYRSSNIDPESFDIDAYWSSSSSKYLAAKAYWGSQNQNFQIQEDLNFAVSEKIQLVAGGLLSHNNLQNAYDNPYGTYTDVATLSAASAAFPQPISNSLANRSITNDLGLYAQGKWIPLSALTLTAGIRRDFNDLYGHATTARLGSTLSYENFNFKLLYGEAYQRPTQRQLFGGWAGSGSSISLRPERSRTIEASPSYSSGLYQFGASLYAVKNTDTIVTVNRNLGGAVNLGTQDILGLDLGFSAVVSLLGFQKTKFWSNYSHYFYADEEKFNYNTGASLGTDIIGDLAYDKLSFGSTINVDSSWDTTARLHCIGRRKLVNSNPIGSIDPYTTVDVSVGYRFLKNYRAALDVTNVLDKEYQHPGIRTADAGSTPGVFVAGTYTGGSTASSYYNSLLPQLGRQVYLSMSADF